MVKHVSKKRKLSTVTPKNFYGNSYRSAVKLGRFGAKAYRYAKKLYGRYNKAKQVYNNSGKSFGSNHNSNFRTTQLQGISQHNDWSKRPSKTIIVGRSEKLMKTLGMYKLTHQYSKVITGTQGNQTYATGMYIFSVLQCQGSTSGVRNSSSLWGTSIYTLNPYSTAPSNAIYPGIAGVAAEDKVVIKDVKSEMRVLSMATIPQRVRVYWCLCRKATAASFITLWINCLADTTLGQGASAASNMISNTSYTPGAPGTTDIGRSPFELAAFRGYFKMLDKDQFILQPGDEITLTRKFVYNKVLMQGYASDMTGSHAPKYTIVPFIIVDGSLVGIATTAGTDAAEVSPGECKVGLMQTDTITLYATPVNRYTINRQEPAIIKASIETSKHIDDVDQVIVEDFN